MKRASLILFALLVISQVNSQQRRLKEGEVFTYQSSSIEGVQALKRYTAEYKVLAVLTDGYQMEARFRLKDEYDDIHKVLVGNKKVTKKIYPEFDEETFNYYYNNSLFTREAVRFKVSNNGTLSHIKTIDPIVGKDTIMDDVLIKYFLTEFGCPYLGQTNDLKKRDELFYRNRLYLVDSILPKKILLKTLLPSDRRNEWKRYDNKKSAKSNKSRTFPKSYHSASTIEYKIEIDKKTGLINEFNSSSGKRERMVLIPTYKDFPVNVIRATSNSPTVIEKPNVRIRGKILNPMEGSTNLTLSYCKYNLSHETYRYSLKMAADSTFEFRIHLDDFEHFVLRYQEGMNIALQPGDDIKMNLTLLDDKLIVNDATGIGSENLKFQQMANPHTSKIDSLSAKFEKTFILFNKTKDIDVLKKQLTTLKRYFNSILEDTSNLTLDPNNIKKGITPEQLKKIKQDYPESMIEKIAQSIVKQTNQIKILEENKNDIIDTQKQINEFTETIKGDFNWKRERLKHTSPEMHLSGFFDNQLKIFLLYQRLITIKPFASTKLQSSITDRLKEFYKELPELAYINGHNDLLRFSNTSTSIRIPFEMHNFAQTYPEETSSISLIKNHHKPEGLNKNIMRYNLAENTYTGFSAYEIKYLIANQSIKRDTRTTYTTLYNRFIVDYPNTKYSKVLTQTYKEVEKVSPGSKAFDFELEDINGNMVKLSDFKGKAVYVDFNAKQENYNEEEQKRLKKLLSEFYNHEDIVFITVLAKHGDFDKKMEWYKKNQLPFVKLVATHHDVKIIQHEYQFNHKYYRAIIDVDGNIVTRFAPGIGLIHTYPQLLYRALISHPKKVDDKATIRILKAIIYIFVILLVAGFIIWDIYRRRTKKKIKDSAIETKIRELELTAIRAQMNPHFMYNCLNSIQNLVQKKQNDEAHRYLSKFAELIRSVLNNSDKEEISLTTELEIIENYVELEKLRFDIDFKINCNEAIDTYSVFLPPLLLQPLVENAILHGLSPKSGDKKLTIDIDRNKENICIAVTDNGVGRNGNKEKSASNGKGISFSLERLNLLSDKYGTGYQMEIIDLHSPTGTKVQICFPDE